MKYLAIGLIASLGAVACASNPPPASESQPGAMTVENADSSANSAANGGLAPSATSEMAADTRPVLDASPATGSGTGGEETNEPSAPPPDNSRVNARDKGSSTLTPMDQGTSEGDRKLTQRVRQAVMKDSSLSFTAKNVKIITINGKVTLRGPVNTEQERSAIEAAAKRIAGETRVDNQIEVKK